jgi:hypothetical protein
MKESVAAKVALPELRVAPLDSLSRKQREAMLEAGEAILECYRVLKKGGINIVGECLKGQGTFYEFDHYPSGDVYDEETHGQYYYHAHRGAAGEHGHFHTFLRQGAMPESVKPAPYDGETKWPEGSDAVCHLVAISMDVYGFPIGMFSTNRWVTDEVWYSADDVVGMLDIFGIDHAYPSWPVNIWITAMFRLFRPEIEALIVHRDASIQAWKVAHPGVDVFEDRNLEVIGQLRVSVTERLDRLHRSLSGG